MASRKRNSNAPIRSPSGSERLKARTVSAWRSKSSLRDHVVADHEAFAHVEQVGRGEAANAQARSLDGGGDEARGRALAVGSGHGDRTAREGGAVDAVDLQEALDAMKADAIAEFGKAKHQLLRHAFSMLVQMRRIRSDRPASSSVRRPGFPFTSMTTRSEKSPFAEMSNMSTAPIRRPSASTAATASLRQRRRGRFGDLLDPAGGAEIAAAGKGDRGRLRRDPHCRSRREERTAGERRRLRAAIAAIQRGEQLARASMRHRR